VGIRALQKAGEVAEAEARIKNLQRELANVQRTPVL
jgi:hypothetical protein